MPRISKNEVSFGAVVLLASTLAAGCYHFSFELPRPVPASATVTYTERVPTYVNGFVGTGRVEASKYCADPIRTELRVTAADVLLSMATLLVYTPHTLSVTCPAAQVHLGVASVPQGSGSTADMSRHE